MDSYFHTGTLRITRPIKVFNIVNTINFQKKNQHKYGFLTLCLTLRSWVLCDKLLGMYVFMVELEM